MYRTVLVETATGQDQTIHRGGLDDCICEARGLIALGFPGSQIDIQFQNEAGLWVSIWTVPEKVSRDD